MSSPTSTRLGRDIRAHIPAASDVLGFISLRPQDRDVWRRAAPFLAVRNNDSHTLYAYGLARALLASMPDADPDVVLPAILLHDTGWSTVDDDLILEAIAPGGGRPDLVLQHEKEGARIATEVLSSLGRDEDLVRRVVEIIDGHDSRLHVALTRRLGSEGRRQALARDAARHRIVCGWFGLLAGGVAADHIGARAGQPVHRARPRHGSRVRGDGFDRCGAGAARAGLITAAELRAVRWSTCVP